MKLMKIKNRILLPLLTLLCLSTPTLALLDFSLAPTYLGLLEGWLLGFTQTAAVASANPCAPQTVYALESAVLINYEVTNASSPYLGLYDLLSNVARLVFHLFGAYAYCSPLFYQMFQVQTDVSTLQKVFRWGNYFIVGVQATEMGLGLLGGDSVLTGLYGGEVMGTGYAYVAEAMDTGFMIN